MPSATRFERLAPDQRAAVELVLRQGRSYGELADLLGMPEETIRARARNGLAALAPDLPAPARAGEICDWLLGQQSQAHAARTRGLVEADPAAKRWAQTIATALREAPGGETVPVPDGGAAGSANGAAVQLDKRIRDGGSADGAVAANVGAVRAGAAGSADSDDGTGQAGAAGSADSDDGTGQAGAAGSAGSDDGAGRAGAAGLVAEDDGAGRAGAAGSAGADDAPGRGRSSRLGGAIVIVASVLLVGLVLAFVLTRGGDEPDQAAGTTPAPTATATATAAAGANDILLKGPAGSQAVGLMRLFQANDGTVRFAIAAQGVAPNESGQTYSLWLRKQDGAAQLLGDVKDPVGDNGELTSAGPGNDDVEEFPQWFADHDTILVTLDDEGAKEPGKVILSGDLPNGG